MLLTTSWDPSKMSPNEFVEYFQTLIEMYEASGKVLSEEDKTAFIVEGLVRGHSKIFEKDLVVADYEGKPLTWLWSNACPAPALATT
jgi:hypothetical protein